MAPGNHKGLVVVNNRKDDKGCKEFDGKSSNSISFIYIYI